MPVRIKKYKCGIVTVSTVGKNPDPDLLRDVGNKEKTYSLKWKHYREIASSLIELWERRVNMVTFFTFTIDQPVSEKALNFCFSKLLENLKKNYGLNSYVWVMEKQKNGNPHYHAVFDMPFVSIPDLLIDKNTGEILFEGKGLDTVWKETVWRNFGRYYADKIYKPVYQAKIKTGQKAVHWDRQTFYREITKEIRIVKKKPVYANRVPVEWKRPDLIKLAPGKFEFAPTEIREMTPGSGEKYGSDFEFQLYEYAKVWGEEWARANLFKSEKSRPVRLPEKQPGKKYRAEVDSIDGLTRYLCKYMVKNIKEKKVFEARCYGISANVRAQSEEITAAELDYLRKKYDIASEIHGEFCSVISFDVLKKGSKSKTPKKDENKKSIGGRSGKRPPERNTNIQHNSKSARICGEKLGKLYEFGLSSFYSEREW